MTARQRADRNTAIFEARARGFAWSRIAADHGITERQAQRIFAEQRRNGSALAARDPVETVEELLLNYDAAIDELAALARDTGHDGARLGAIRARVEVMKDKVKLLAALGILPDDLGHFRVLLDGRRVTDALFRVLDRHDALTDEVADDLLDELGGPPPGFAMNGGS